MKQTSFSDAEFAAKQRLTRCERFLAEIEAATIRALSSTCCRKSCASTTRRWPGASTKRNSTWPHRQRQQGGAARQHPRQSAYPERNKDKAKVQIGDRVPVITTTSTSTGFVSESVSYVDVGLKLEVEPIICHCSARQDHGFFIRFVFLSKSF
jgi:hypothetical protein